MNSPRKVGDLVKVVKRGHPRLNQIGEIVTVYPNLTNRSTQQYRVEFSEIALPAAPNRNIALNFIRHRYAEDFYDVDLWDA